VDAKDISAAPRSRRRRTIAPNQLALALDGSATHACAVNTGPDAEGAPPPPGYDTNCRGCPRG
jgi:hypothetical protein